MQVDEGIAFLSDSRTNAMVSMDSTMRSNATVGPPVEMLIYRQHSLTSGTRRTFKRDDPYLINLRRADD
jgi:putative proteasome-type protease